MYPSLSDPKVLTLNHDLALHGPNRMPYLILPKENAMRAVRSQTAPQYKEIHSETHGLPTDSEFPRGGVSKDGQPSSKKIISGYK